MKKNFMQKLFKIPSHLILSLMLAFFYVGCASSSKNEERVIPQTLSEEMTQDAMDNSDFSKNQLIEKDGALASSHEDSSAHYTNGLLPPLEDKDIMLPYYVKSGETLSHIAQKIYGSAAEWKKLAKINKIQNQNKIFSGDVLYYTLDHRSQKFAMEYESAKRAKIVAQKGDTLSGMAQAIFGNASEWRVLWKENPQIQNPDKLLTGQAVTFRVSSLPKNVASSQISVKEFSIAYN